ncbi:hypothetical protein [Streptomyces sp. S1]|uniref:hypothetical protein n=1 Tax=Streptomyces sp. S1 TaxID=718288 RepID=UPI003D72FD73
MRYQRVYTEGGTVAHLIDTALDSPNDPSAQGLCGRTPWPGYWHGTGTQEEEETAADLKICAPCSATFDYREGGSGGRPLQRP